MLYTKNGRPLQRRGADLSSRSGRHVGRISDNKVFSPPAPSTATGS